MYIHTYICTYIITYIRTRAQNYIKMAKVSKSSVKQSDIQSLDSVHYLNGKCGNCVLMNHKYQEAFVDLKSLQLINTMLQEEIKTEQSTRRHKDVHH